jgi:hypothetical protein
MFREPESPPVMAENVAPTLALTNSTVKAGSNVDAVVAVPTKL